MITHPSKSKFRKVFKGRIRGKAKNCHFLKFGGFGLKALQSKRIKEKQIEAARKVINGYLKRTGKLWIRVFPSVPVSQKPIDVRMGRGKGAIAFWVSKIKPGKILFELDLVTKKQAMIAFSKAAAKLPIKTTFIYKG